MKLGKQLTNSWLMPKTPPLTLRNYTVNLIHKEQIHDVDTVGLF